MAGGRKKAPSFKPLAGCSTAALRRVRFVLADIDGTLTTEGRLTAQVYTALEQLTEAGIHVIPITGRPAGWCDQIARMWPVDAVVGENGAFWFRYDAAKRRLIKRFLGGGAERTTHRARIEAIGRRILSQVRGAALASDQLYRDADLAIDYAEDVRPLDVTSADRIARLMEAEGLTAKISSIHVNGWFGDYDKLSTTRKLLRTVYGLRDDETRACCAFIGDSPNDSPMFKFFPFSVGVANVRDFLSRLPASPAFITRRREGAGFVEFADRLRRVPRK
jgi:HAD superfamily hydrolase (TIGR01484 family)